MNADFETFLSTQREIVDQALRAQVAAWERVVPDTLAQAMSYSLLAGGKRVRPILALAAFDACGGDDARRPLALDWAVALEMIHTYSLIHDDLPAMDDDDLRRGRPTCHILYGEATAILAGDALLTEAFTRLSRGTEVGGGEAGGGAPPSDAPERLALVALLARAAGAVGMVGGQQLDLAMEGRAGVPDERGERGPRPSGPETPTLEDVEEVHRRKTGALLAAAVEGGAIAAGAGPVEIAALRRYGQALGLAFQIADDILDEVGDPAQMGKSGGSDRAKGKPTVPILVGLDEARRLARQAKGQALEALAEIGEEAGPLRSLARYVVERTL